jgi:hypothetical protein
LEHNNRFAAFVSNVRKIVIIRPNFAHCIDAKVKKANNLHKMRKICLFWKDGIVIVFFNQSRHADTLLDSKIENGDRLYGLPQRFCRKQLAKGA